uniref:Putative capsid protein n=1 Tax=viral metagenome TaxID=1070528 RepID=A0A6H1Z964_9ZZZZ
MGNPLTSAQFVKLLVADQKEVTEGGFDELPSMIPSFYKMLPSDSAWEEFYSVGSLPDVPEFTGKLEYLGIAPGYTYRIEPKEFAGAIQIERKFLDDNKYPVLRDRARSLGDSAARVREKYGVRTFGYAFSSSFDFLYSEEGVSLCSSSHSTKSGTSTTYGFDNSGTTAISKTALGATRILMRQFRNDISERIVIEPDMIVVPDAKFDETCEAVGYMPETGASSQLDPDSAENTINSQYRRFKVVAYPRLDDYDTNNWFMVDSKLMKKHLMWIDRVPREVNTTVDFETFYAKTSIYFRIGYGWNEWRWCYGHVVS